MKIFIDMGHPAHVHYFRNFIKIMEERGHIFFVTARNKEVTHELLKAYNINFVNRGKGRNGIFGKAFYILEGDYQILKHAFRFKPDIFLSFGSAYAAHVSKLMFKPHIAYDDTEHAKFEHMLYVPFTDVILTPSCFSKDFRKKQIFFDGYMELCYLHHNYFTPSKKVIEDIGIKETDKYVILRFVSWNASHDIGQKGIKNETKLKVIRLLEQKKFKVFISSESVLPMDLEKYRLKIDPMDLHKILANASLYIGEGSTTASECSVLGVPNIYVNSLTVGYCKEQQEKYSLCIHLKSDNYLISSVSNLLEMENISEVWLNRRKKMLDDKIDSTAFMVWFIENYPNSFKIMKENPEYQYNFK